MMSDDSFAYPFNIQLRLDWSEQDLFEHINNVNFFKYTQAARLQILEKIGLTQHYDSTNVGPLLGQTKCRFLAPLHYPGFINVRSRIASRRTTSFVLEHSIVNEQTEIVALAEDIIVVYDYTAKSKADIPGDVSKVIDSFINKA